MQAFFEDLKHPNQVFFDFVAQEILDLDSQLKYVPVVLQDRIDISWLNALLGHLGY